MALPNIRKRVFEIAKVEKTDNQLRVAGRAYESIRVGDIVFACTSEAPDSDYASYLVTKITLYNREVDEIQAVFTAWMFLEGDNEGVLSASSYLFAGSS